MQADNATVSKLDQVMNNMQNTYEKVSNAVSQVYLRAANNHV
jgi:hypothetical protein